MINEISISYGCVFKKSSTPVMKGFRVKSIEEAKSEYKNFYRKGGQKLIDSIVFLKCLLGTLPKIWHYKNLIARKASEWKIEHEKLHLFKY